jgi:hypothetical protein
MALKKKQHAQREERLRQAILERRRQEMQEVTDKFQRLGRRPSVPGAHLLIYDCNVQMQNAVSCCDGEWLLLNAKDESIELNK